MATRTHFHYDFKGGVDTHSSRTEWVRLASWGGRHPAVGFRLIGRGFWYSPENGGEYLDGITRCRAGRACPECAFAP